MQWKIVPRSQFTGSDVKPSWYAEPRTKHATRRKSARYIGRRFRQSLCISQHSVYIFWQSFFTPGRKVLRMVTQCNRARQSPLCYTEDTRFAHMTAQYPQNRARSDLWLKVRSKTETQFQLRDLQRDRRLEILTLRRKECIPESYC